MSIDCMIIRQISCKMMVGTMILIFIVSNGYTQQKSSPVKMIELVNILNNACQAYDRIETISGKLDINLGSPEPGISMSIAHIIGTCRQQRVVGDSTVGWYIANEFAATDRPEDGYQVFYKGDSLTYFMLKDSITAREGGDKVVSEWGFATFDKWKKRMELYRARLTQCDSVFQKHEDVWLIGDISLLKDSVISGRECYVIESRKQGSKPEFKMHYSNCERLAIDKELFYPVMHWTHFQRFVNEEPQIDQVCCSVLSDCQLNKELSDTIFDLKEKIKMQKEKQVVTLAIGDLPPNWKLKDVTGDSLSLFEQQGKMILLEFGYIGCGACAMAAGEIKKEILDVCDPQKYRFIYINTKDSFEKMQQYCREKHADFPMLQGNEELAEKYGIVGYPCIFILDTECRILKIVPGYFEGMGKRIRGVIE